MRQVGGLGLQRQVCTQAHFQLKAQLLKVICTNWLAFFLNCSWRFTLQIKSNEVDANTEMADNATYLRIWS